MSRLLWTYCNKCDKRIEVGDICYDVGEDTYCTEVMEKGERTMTCKDCIHFDVCDYHITELTPMTVAECQHFKSKADYVEVKRGEWIYHECVSSYDGAISGYSCSLCNAFVNEDLFESDEFHKDFCGHCGAKMDGKE